MIVADLRRTTEGRDRLTDAFADAEKKAADIASDLQMATETVRVARRRALMRLRECVAGGSLE